MNDSQKIARLQTILEPVINWYKKTEAAGEVDSSYLYDTTYERFDDLLRRGDFQEIIELLK